MSIERVRTSPQGKEQLSRLKRNTGIEHWNVLCRWAFCTSLAEKTIPPSIDIKGDDAIEMTWKVFGGQCQEIYLALIKERCKQDNLPIDDKTVAEQFRLHLHRGLGYLASDASIKAPYDAGRRSPRGLLEMIGA